MKNFTIIFFTVFITGAFAQNINISSFKLDLDAYLSQQTGKKINIINEEPVKSSSGESLFVIYRLYPQGFVLCGNDSLLPPIVAYSFSSSITARDTSVMMLVKQTESLKPMLNKINPGWLKMSQETQKAAPEYWPAQGTTTTEGWVETRWTQTAPYNNYCPVDPLSSQRSYAGCPSIVMSQILNFWKTTKNKRFGADDRYYHSYGGRDFWIDDDYQLHGFPSFIQLNEDLDTLDAHYLTGSTLTNKDKAALVFACGVACTQVFSSAGSGTFGVNQAYEAYQHFGFSDCVLYTDTSANLLNVLINDMQNGRPAHLAVVDESWQTGHNVVIDGYNSDGYFHINFGWGGSSDGWWLVPDASFPYQMSVIEGVIAGINPMQSAGIPDISSRVSVYPNPCDDIINLVGFSGSGKQISVYDERGREVLKAEMNNPVLKVDNLSPGLYLLKTSEGTARFVIQH